jgi:hypothetical protein
MARAGVAGQRLYAGGRAGSSRPRRGRGGGGRRWRLAVRAEDAAVRVRGSAEAKPWPGRRAAGRSGHGGGRPGWGRGERDLALIEINAKSCALYRAGSLVPYCSFARY